MFGLPSAEKLAMLANMPALQARRLLQERGAEMMPDQLYEMVLLATGSERMAEETVNRRLKAMLKAGMPVG